METPEQFPAEEIRKYVVKFEELVALCLQIAGDGKSESELLDLKKQGFIPEEAKKLFSEKNLKQTKYWLGRALYKLSHDEEGKPARVREERGLYSLVK